MSETAMSIAHVPLDNVLPRDYAVAASDPQRIGRELDVHHAAAGRVLWCWYPEHITHPPVPAERGYLTLFDTTISLFNTGVEWLELTLDVARSAELAVNAAVEVAC